MLPIFRVLPISGVCLAVAILLLALHPPRATPPLAPRLLSERGPLIDRDEHPELRQFLVLAALHRANAVERLRAIPETHIPPAPLPRHPPAGLSLLTPAPATLFSPEAAPAAAPAPKKKANPPEESKIVPQAEANTKLPVVNSAVVKSAPVAAATPAVAVVPVATPAKSATEKRPATVITMLPRPRPSNNGAITASIGADNESPMQAGIGAASALELPVELPRERPATLRKRRYRPVSQAKLKQRHTVKRRHKPAERKPIRKAAQLHAGDSFDLFTAMFGSPAQPSVRNRKGQP